MPKGKGSSRRFQVSSMGQGELGRPNRGSSAGSRSSSGVIRESLEERGESRLETGD